jgi:hypothetical protein
LNGTDFWTSSVYSEISFLSLPIPKALALFAVILPFISGVSTQGTNILLQRSSKKNANKLSLSLIAVIGFQLMYETIIATLAISHILPPSALDCGLNDSWQRLYGAKNDDAIRAIQDKFKCCGFKTVKDRAYPFGDHVASTCATDFHRSESCLVPWRAAEQANASWLLLVAVIVFIVKVHPPSPIHIQQLTGYKVLSIISLFTRPAWASSRWAQTFIQSIGEVEEEPEDRNRAVMRRLINDGAGDERYHDDAEEDDPTTPRALEVPNSGDQGPRIQPSQLVQSGHERRDE